MSSIFEQLQDGTSTILPTSKENTIILQTKIPLDPTDHPTIYYLDKSSNTNGVPLTDILNSKEVLTNISNSLSSTLSNVSLPLNCHSKEILLKPINDPNNRLQFELEFSVPQVIQKVLISLSKQMLPPQLQTNPHLWITHLEIDVFQPHPPILPIQIRYNQIRTFSKPT
jgi:hypothetical protein